MPTDSTEASFKFRNMTTISIQQLSAAFLLSFLLLALSSALPAQAQPAAELKDFTFTIEQTDNGIRLESQKGSAWINISFSSDCDAPQAIDEYGMTRLEEVDPEKDEDLADFLFTITKTATGIRLDGIEGTAWKELSFSLQPNEKQTINQFGMLE